MKKLLLVLLTIVTIVIGVGCDNTKPVDKDEPIFPNEATDTVYATVKTGEVTFNITKEDMYVYMRNEVGLGLLVEWTNEKMLSKYGKKSLYEFVVGEKFDGVDDTKYIDLVTEEEIKARLESDKYPNGKDSYTDDEIKTLEQKFTNNFYNYGYRTEEEIKNYYRIEIAKEKLAKDYQELVRNGYGENITGNDFSTSEYQNYWKKNYYNQYYMILVPFESTYSCINTFKELNITIDDSDKGNVKFVNSKTNEELSENEVIAAYIKLYNNSNLFKESVSSAYQLTEGNEYTIVDGKYQFNLEKDSVLYYSNDDVKVLNSDLVSLIEKLVPYGSENEGKFYIANSGSINNVYYTALLLGKEEKQIDYDDNGYVVITGELKAQIKEKLMESEFTEDYVSNLMDELREKNELVIYDKILQNGYINNYMPSGEFYDGSVITNDVCVFMNEVLKKDEFFDILDKRFGAYWLGELINYYDVLYDKTINTIYDVSKVGPESTRILRKLEWDESVLRAANLKNSFDNGEYGYYGFTMGSEFQVFLEENYFVRTQKEFAFKYMREILLGEYLQKKYSLAEYEENSLYWQKFEKYMQDLADEYYKATGFQIALTYLDENGQYASPETWTEEQTALVKEFYGLLVDYLTRLSASYKDAVEALMLKYQQTQYLIGDNKSGELFNGMDLAKYKSSGIILVYEDLGTFTNGELNEGLSKAAKELWDLDPSSSEAKVYGKTSEGYNYIISDNGYHVYFNIRNTDMSRYEERNIPTLEEIKIYIADNDSDDLTEEQITMIENYYVNIYSELINIYNSASSLYERQGNYEVLLKTDNYTYDVYKKTLSITLQETNSQIVYEIK